MDRRAKLRARCVQIRSSVTLVEERRAGNAALYSHCTLYCAVLWLLNATHAKKKEHFSYATLDTQRAIFGLPLTEPQSAGEA